MALYQIKEHEVPLFPIRYVMSIFGTSRSSILRKEERGQLSEANFYNSNKQRLYSIEDLAVIDYIYREVFPYRQGVKTPDWVKDLTRDALAQSKRLVLQYGKSRNEDDWRELSEKYSSFNRFRLQTYIESWRRRLIDIEKFFPELVDDEL